MVREVRGDSTQSPSVAALYKEFESHRRAYGFGQFLGVEEIAQKEKAVSETVDLFADMLGFTGARSWRGRETDLERGTLVESQLPQRERRRRRGGRHRINDIVPSQVGAIEAYANSQFVPERFAGRGECGLVVIWMRKTPPATAGHAPALRGNGYP
jgi:hypothetical protein